MRVRLLACGLGLFISTCAVEIEMGSPEAGEPDATGMDANIDADIDIVSEEELKLLAEQDELERKLKAGEPITPEEEISDLSAYQRGVLGNENDLETNQERTPTWLLLARQAYSEGAGDVEALLQMDLNLAERWKVSLPEAIKRRAPHVSGLKETTRARQKMTSTLPGWGDDPGELWAECDRWTQHPETGRWKGFPKGCHGSWKNTLPRWKDVRAKAKEVYKSRPTAVDGHPVDQGGIMDLAAYLKRSPHMCLLGSPGTSNYYFGWRKDTRNTCLTPTAEQLAKSRKVAKQIDRRDKRRNEGKYARKTISVKEVMAGFNKSR